MADRAAAFQSLELHVYGYGEPRGYLPVRQNELLLCKLLHCWSWFVQPSI